MSSQAPAKSSLIYLYVGSDWSGPFQVEQIRFFRHHGQVESDTYAYDPDQQRHYTVGELLAAADAAGHVHLEGTETAENVGSPLASPDLDETSTPSTTRIFLAADEADPTATIGTSLDALPDPLRSFVRNFRELTEGQPTDREQTLANLAEMASAIGIQLSAAITDVATLQGLTDDVLRVADYLANRTQDDALWEAIDALRSHKPEVDADEAAQAARLVISCLVQRAQLGLIEHITPGLVPALRDQTRDVTPSLTDSQEIKAITDTWDQPHAKTARMILRDARKELKSTEADLEAIQAAYTQLQEAHTRDLTEAREMLANLESARADEVANAAQAMAEVRSLAAEIHRLAEETLIGEDDLKGEIRQLADELKGQDATAMAPLAEALLIRLVARLRNLAADPASVQQPGEVGLLREDLAKVRGELVGARAQILVLTDERDRLKRQLDEQRAAADRAISNSKEREQRLRSTVTALEVTKDLHQDVMRELEVQLTTAQKRVGEMEGELSNVRGELTNTRTHLADRTQELQSEMRRAVELQAMLEARRAELSNNLKDAEAQLQQAQVDQAAPGAAVDPELMEALAAKVNHLRTMFEATKRRLDEQQQLALKLEDELSASRREASELRGRSDALTGELDEARVGLASAKKRFEELNRAYSRLEVERESLQSELTQRKGTDTLRKGTDAVRRTGPHDRPTDSVRNDGSQSGTARLNKVLEALEARVSDTQRKLEQANAQLESERRRVQELSLSHSQFQVRVDDLTADRDHLRSELDRLSADNFAEHSRHAAAISVATQSTIDAERRLKATIARQVELEDQVAWLQQHQQPADVALQQLSVEGEEHVSGQFVSPEHVGKLTRELEDARAELERLQAQQSSNASGQRHTLNVRLAQVEADLQSASVARDEAVSALHATVAERDRLARELGRLRGEHESAAVEHRASLKSARDKLGESQARVQVLEKELEHLRALPIAPDPKIAERDAERSSERIAELTSERDRLAEQVRELTVGIARAGVADELPVVRRQLDQELERIKALTRSLAEAQTQSDQIRSRVAELEGRASNAQHERDQLQIEIERLKGELMTAQAYAGAARDTDHGRRSQIEVKLQEVLTDREQLLGELSRVNADLMQVRGRLVRVESESLLVDRLPLEYGRVRDLEAQLTQLRTDQQSTVAELAQVRARLSQTTHERDQLQEEVTRLRAQLAQVSVGAGAHLVDELMALRDKLTRAKARIRALRQERDALLARAGQPAALVRPHTTQHFGLSSAARGAVADDLPTDAPSGGASATIERAASRGHRAPQPAMRTGVPVMPVGGFTSAFGRPSIPMPVSAAGLTSEVGDGESLTPPPALVTAMSRANAEQPVVVAVRRPWLAPVIGAAAVGGVLLAAALAVRPMALHGMIIAQQQRITAPIAGQVTLAVTAGDLVNTGATIATIRNDRLDRSQFDALSARRQALVARQAATQAELDQVQAGPTESDPLRQADRITRLQELEHTADDTAGRLDGLAKEVTAEEQRLEALAERVVVAERPQQIRRLLAASDGRIAAGTELMEVVDTASIESTAELPIGSEIAVGDVVAITVLPSGPMGEGTVLSVAETATGRLVHVAVPAELRQASLVGARTRLALLGAVPGRLDRFGERLWRTLSP